jgi:sugar/nucleoside kinase (ribokinase family)
MPATCQPDYVCVGGIIIDDIVLPDGETRMAVLGGGVTHAAAGMVIWDHRPGLVACAGYDLPDSARERLERDFDLQGVDWLELPQARAWQIFEWDGKRTEIPRVDRFEPFISGMQPENVPDVYRRARGMYLLSGADRLAGWRAVCPNAVFFWEPEQPFMVHDNADEFRAVLPQVDIVSPNWLEAQQVYGLGDPGALVRAMLDDGAPVVALRMGEHGSLVGARQGDDLLAVPAVPVPEIIDQTGAGNTYCGGFLAGWIAQGGDLLAAACYGAVAASFSLEVTGVAGPLPDLAEQRNQRYRWLAAHLGGDLPVEPGAQRGGSPLGGG